jgi:signal transduction protein with GAF and PtsI domain
MSEIVAYAAAFGAAVSIISIIKFWMDIGAMKRDATIALSKAEGIGQALSDFKALVARDYASTQALAASETRLATAIEGMRSDFREMTGRIDRILSAINSVSVQGQGH